MFTERGTDRAWMLRERRTQKDSWASCLKNWECIHLSKEGSTAKKEKELKRGRYVKKRLCSVWCTTLEIPQLRREICAHPRRL